MSRNKKTSESLFQFMNLLIALLLKNGQYRTSLHYKATLNSFKRYRDNKDIALKEIDAEVMRSYEAYLHHTAEVCRNTSSFYLRILRATYNRAVAKGLTPQQYPFTDVYTGMTGDIEGELALDQESAISQGSHSQGRDGKRYIPDEFLSAWYLFHRPGTPPEIRPQGRLSPLHPKQDRSAPHHPMGEGYAEVVRKISTSDSLLTLSFPFPC